MVEDYTGMLPPYTLWRKIVYRLSQLALTESIFTFTKRKKQPATDKDNPVVKVSPEAYNALVEIYNESTISMKDIASLLIVEGSKHVVYDKEE